VDWAGPSSRGQHLLVSRGPAGTVVLARVGKSWLHCARQARLGTVGHVVVGTWSGVAGMAGLLGSSLNRSRLSEAGEAWWACPITGGVAGMAAQVMVRLARWVRGVPGRISVRPGRQGGTRPGLAQRDETGSGRHGSVNVGV
jgi:hypothetical protein